MLISSTAITKTFPFSLQVGGDKKFPMKYVEQEMSWSYVRKHLKNQDWADSFLTFSINKLLISHLTTWKILLQSCAIVLSIFVSNGGYYEDSHTAILT